MRYLKENTQTALAQLATYLTMHNLTISCAESCTGGGLAYAFTSLPGSSIWFKHSVVTYSNEAKQIMVGVTDTTLKQYGAVSEQTVAEMAHGVVHQVGANIGISISGIAGPDGGSAAVAQGPDGNTAAVAQGPYGNTVVKGPAGNVAVSSDTNSQQSDYVLKSQIVPPVCPACPSLVAAADELNNNSSSSSSDDSNGDSSDDSNGSSSSSSDDTNGDSNGDTCTSESCYEGNTYKREVNVKCPPCPPCARCPEPAFDCKKVPAYRESDDRYLPRPMLNDFSTFGM